MKTKNEVIKMLFSYLLKRADKYGLNVLLSIDGITKIALCGEPSETYSKLYNDLNKDIIIENEWKRKCNMTFKDLFNKINVINEISSKSIFGEYERYVGNDGFDIIDTTSARRMPFINKNNEKEYSKFLFINNLNINNSISHVIVIIRDFGVRGYFSDSIVFVEKDNGMHVGIIKINRFGIDITKEENISELVPIVNNGKYLSFNEFFNIISKQTNFIDNKEDIIGSLSSIIDYQIPKRCE